MSIYCWSIIKKTAIRIISKNIRVFSIYLNQLHKIKTYGQFFRIQRQI